MSEVGAVSALDYDDLGLEEMRARSLQAASSSIRYSSAEDSCAGCVSTVSPSTQPVKKNF